MEFRELKSLCALAGTGSLSETARSLHLTPAAIHKQLKHLETELEIPLYERKGGSLRLTAAAELLLPYVRNILGQFESAVGALEEWRGVRRGLIRVGAGPSLATYVLPAILRAFHEQFPYIDLDVQTGSSLQLLSALQGGTLDLAVAVAPGAIEEPSLQIVFEQVVEIVLVTDLPDTPVRTSLARLRDHAFLLFRKGSRIENLIDHYLAEHDFAPNVIMRFDSAEALRATLLTGTGISMLPQYTVDNDIRAGRLKRIRQKEPPLLMKIHVLAKKSVYMPPAVTEFIETIVKINGM
jgi:DNA-binding transcriptional LysR family regulator